MSRIRGKDTKPEIMLRKALWHRGHRYRKNYPGVFGTPDIVFLGQKVAVFVDSVFWHGKKYMDEGKLPKTNTEYWEKKLKRNIARDRAVNESLERDGWVVIRCWDDEVLKNLQACVKKVEDAIKWQQRQGES